jgi:hypothetical protein
MAIQTGTTILTALHYLFTHTHEEKVVAHCLDLDLVVSGTDIDKAEERLNAVVLAQISSCFTAGNFAQLRFKAPNSYWEALSEAKDLSKKHLEVEVPPIVLPVERSVVSLQVYRGEVMAMAA